MGSINHINFQSTYQLVRSTYQSVRSINNINQSVRSDQFIKSIDQINQYNNCSDSIRALPRTHVRHLWHAKVPQGAKSGAAAWNGRMESESDRGRFGEGKERPWLFGARLSG